MKMIRRSRPNVTNKTDGCRTRNFYEIHLICLGEKPLRYRKHVIKESMNVWKYGTNILLFSNKMQFLQFDNVTRVAHKFMGCSAMDHRAYD